MTAPANTSNFAAFFQGFKDHYVVIGGTPTALFIEDRLQGGVHTTKDLDAVALDISEDGTESKFLGKFEEYVKICEYECENMKSGKAQAYRFTKPKKEDAPKTIEIATVRTLNVKVDQKVQRLDEFDMSALVCEPAYIELLRKYRASVKPIDDLPVANPSLVIAMKALAHERLSQGTDEEQRRAKKHLTDIAKLTLILVENDAIDVPAEVFATVERLLKERASLFPADRLKACGWEHPNDSAELEKTVRLRIKLKV